MKQAILFFIVQVWTLIDFSSSTDHQFYIYELDQTLTLNRQDHDCFQYYIRDTVEQIPKASDAHQHQIMRFCMRSSNASDDERVLANQSLLFGNLQAITFDELSRQNVSYEQLLVWSTSIDLVEQYQLYLDNRTKSSVQRSFYKCFPPWFGTYCQYQFLEQQHYFFDRLVQSTFSRLKDSSELTDIQGQTCYMHLMCKRGPKPLCLDWREICDGKLDCLDGGQDEMDCFDLEIHQCDANEYRCHNGMQCIPHEFYQDDIAHPDCIDRTDENDTKEIPGIYEENCYYDPSFRCEEHSCRSTSLDNFVCGDGMCVDDYGECGNGRGNMFILAMLHPQTDNDESRCRLVIMCMTWRRCPDLCSSIATCARMIRRFCQQSLFAFPTYPILFGHVRFIFSNNRSPVLLSDPLGIDDDFFLLLPEYLCYEKELCEDLSPGHTIRLENRTCLYFGSKFTLFSVYKWHHLIYLVKRYFYRCSTIHDLQNRTHCRHESLYQCVNSSKCISKSRLRDKIQDCYENDDETLNLVPNPSNASTHSSRVIAWNFFPLLCDGYIDMRIETGWNETDETYCQWWPCNNIYTRCNRIWNCPNGIDEVNCAYLPLCPLSFYPCISPETYNLTCLSVNQSGNDIVDCIGASDEVHMCRRKDFLYRGPTFRCGNSSTCLDIDISYLCNGKNDCPLRDDELVCDQEYWLACADPTIPRKSAVINFLCHAPSSKATQIFVSLRNLVQYPKTNAIDPHQSTSLMNATTLNQMTTTKSFTFKKNKTHWQCNRGIHVLVRQNRSANVEKCLCPPAYYGNLCQYQNQRISMTLQLQTEGEWRIPFALAITLVDEQYNIESYEQIQYLAVRDCNDKFNVNLLYSTRPKNLSKNYSIRIDVYTRHTLIYRTSWIFPIIYPFLPVYRIATRLLIPLRSSADCSHVCHRGHCIQFSNKNSSACRCDPGWTGPQCSTYRHCSCAADSLCLYGGWPSICLCPLHKFGPRCYLTRRVCQPDTCNYHGQCIPTDERMAINNFTCICHEGFSGEKCQHTDSKIIIRFDGVSIPSSVLGHFILADGNTTHVRTTIFKKIPLTEDTVVLYTSNKFHLLFIEFTNHYYLAIAQEHPILWATVTTSIDPGYRCWHINELFNSTVLEFSFLRRIKLYHILCEHQLKLQCFYDEFFLCLCTNNRFANCMDFNHQLRYDCQGRSVCHNGAQCFQDNPTCPTTSMCLCPECFYGTYCQFSTMSFALSLDVLLGYKIRPHVRLTEQPMSIRITTTVVLVMFIFSLMSNMCSICTFRTQTSQQVGCGLYLLSTSIVSLLTICIFSLKLFMLIYAQIVFDVSRSFLRFNCISMDFLLRIFSSVGDWFNACVALERTWSIRQGVRFDRNRSKSLAKWMILNVIFFTICTTIHDPLHRRLVDDPEEQRIWCTTTYSSTIRLYDSLILFFHFLGPLTINGLSAFIIIVTIARQRSVARTKKTFREHLRDQFHQNKYLLISPCILVLLGLPRIILVFLSHCMQSPRNPWRFLIGYFLSFCPSVLNFVVFVLPSKIYREEFIRSIKWRK